MSSSKSKLDIGNLSQYEDIVNNPCLFVRKVLNITPREFQDEILADPSPKKVLRICRRGGKTLLLAMWSLWKIMVNSGYRIIYVAPYDNQVKEFFDQIDEIRTKSEMLNLSVKRRSSKPYHIIRLKNNAVIKGFSSGVRTKMHADQIRGQGCDALILDEADRLSDEDFDTLMALLMESPNMPIYIASTPTGKRSRFYMYCVQKDLGFVEFHKTCWQAIPGWNEERDREARTVLFPTEFAYRTEALAEFGEPAEGVFKQKFLNSLFINYRYSSIKDLEKYVITMGVDWDKYSTGPSIIVCGYEEQPKVITVIDRITIPPSEFTLDSAVEKIIDLNKKYNPAWIYIDRGWGEMQIELLQKYGKQHPESGLYDKVVGIHLGSSLDVWNNVTNTVERVNAKQWAVNQLVTFIEKGSIVFSSYDKELRRQMDNFRAIRINEATGPVYVGYDDHLVMALCLAVLAICDNILMIGKRVRKSAGLLFTSVATVNTEEDPVDRGTVLADTIKSNKYVYTVSYDDMKRFKFYNPYSRRQVDRMYSRTRNLGF